MIKKIENLSRLLTINSNSIVNKIYLPPPKSQVKVVLQVTFMKFSKLILCKLYEKIELPNFLMNYKKNYRLIFCKCGFKDPKESNSNLTVALHRKVTY